MISAQAAEFGINAIIGLGQGYLARVQAEAQNTIGEANTAAANLLRKAGNELSAKKGSLARYTQMINNQRAMENTGSQIEAAAVNYRRARDGAISDDLESQIAFAEQAGAQAASSAASGLSGGIADLVSGTTALRKARVQARQAENLRLADYDAGRAAADIYRQGLDSMDQSGITDDIDFGMNVFTAQKRAGNLFTDIMGKQTASSTQWAVNAVGKQFSFNSPSQDVQV